MDCMDCLGVCLRKVITRGWKYNFDSYFIGYFDSYFTKITFTDYDKIFIGYRPYYKDGVHYDISEWISISIFIGKINN